MGVVPGDANPETWCALSGCMVQVQQTNSQRPSFQPEFLHLRQAILLYLDKAGSSTRDPELHLLREGVARTEWKAITRDRRIWAMGNAAGGMAGFDDATEWARREWKELDPKLRRVLSERILDWVRR